MTKRLLLTFLCIVLLITATACGDTQSGDGATTPEQSNSPNEDISGGAIASEYGTGDMATEPPKTSPSATETQQGASSEKWALTTFSDFSEEDAADTAGTNDALLVGKTADGKNIFAFIRFDLGANWLANELTDAKLFLKPTGADVPERLRISLLTGGWDGSFTPRSEAVALVDKNEVTTDVSKEDGGWISVPLTNEVKSWLGGDLQNNGVAVFGETDDTLYTFVSDEANEAYILASGAAGDRALDYGKFGYNEMITEKDDEIVGNCLSYSLRDENPIENEHLKGDEKKMAKLYKEGGLDALTDYHTQLLKDYVEAHKDKLQISSFRQIENFDSEIDPLTEYRIAMRLGADPMDGEVDFKEPSAFDFHFWLQLNDGRWAQKFPTGASQIIPCTGPDISPGKFPWHSSYFWTPKSRDFYTGKTVYFAVTKDTDEFTRHRG